MGEDYNQPLKNARQLFAKALETPEGLKVQTIHAFCERILARFPIEAGILPGFDPLDEAETATIRDEVRDTIYKMAAKDEMGEISKAIRIITSHMADQTFEGLLKWMSHSTDKIERWAARGGTDGLAAELNISAEANLEDIPDIKAAAWAAAPKSELKVAALELISSTNAKEQTRGQFVLDALVETDPQKAFALYAQGVFKEDLTPFGQLGSKNSGPNAQVLFGAWNKVDTPEVARMADVGQQINAILCLSMTRAVYCVATAFAAEFKRAKNRRRGLDFNDQVLFVRNLLRRSEVSEWVRYKLDGGIEHILLDEAQDTSPAQWDIIDALAEEFEQERRDVPQARTLFAVGDEKQSIYSFQGAEPEQFLKKIQYYTQGHKALSPRMRMSFRSAPEILEFVDQIFIGDGVVQRMFDAKEYPPASDLVGHTAHRQDNGQVDLWPAVEKPESEDEKAPWDTTPVNALTQGDAREQLAQKIAQQIDAWIKDKEPVYDRKLERTRPVHAGDILILVRQRNDFFDAVIRNLKACGVAVAGADRLKLKDSIAVKDLLSLAKFALLQQDDLSLAEVLKSPLFNYSVEDLFEVSAGRDGSLWSAIKNRRSDTAQTLSDILTYVRRFAPYEFFTRVLDMPGASGPSMRRQIFKRLGLEAKDAIEAFLARALAHQREGSPSLAHFVQSFAADEQELKREMDSGSGDVRVMTVHGSKGLEAPIVFLPDTTQLPTKSGPVIKLESGYAVPTSSKHMPAALTPYKEAMKAKREQEYLRLLYVALTRAESRLVLCGYKHGRGKGTISKKSWYEDMEHAFKGLETRPIETPFGEGLSFGAGAKPYESVEADAPESSIALPSWINNPAKAAPTPRRHVTPSHLLAPPPHNDMPVRSPLTQATETRFIRGNLIHKLLEILPEFEGDKQTKVVEKMLAGYKALNPEKRDEIISEVFAVLHHPEFADIFAPGSRAEISLAGSAKSLPEHLYLNAQIDRISVTENKVFIVDYKSNRPPPKTQDGVADIYWGQMAAYRELAREIYPSHEIVCALLWTDGPRLMILDDERLDAALTQIALLPT